MAGPERRFIDKVHRRLAPTIFKECYTGMIGSNGTPDYYYEGPTGALRIEYKGVDGKFPKTIDLINKKPKLTPLQRRWVDRAHKNDIEVAVILGGDQGGIIFTEGSWARKHALSDLRIWTLEDISDAIFDVVFESCVINNWQSE
jgi:hypothetical protein